MKMEVQEMVKNPMVLYWICGHFRQNEKALAFDSDE